MNAVSATRSGDPIRRSTSSGSSVVPRTRNIASRIASTLIFHSSSVVPAPGPTTATGSVPVNAPSRAAATVVLPTPRSPGMSRSAPESISWSATRRPISTARAYCPHGVLDIDGPVERHALLPRPKIGRRPRRTDALVARASTFTGPALTRSPPRASTEYPVAAATRRAAPHRDHLRRRPPGSGAAAGGEPPAIQAPAHAGARAGVRARGEAPGGCVGGDRASISMATPYRRRRRAASRTPLPRLRHAGEGVKPRPSRWRCAGNFVDRLVRAEPAHTPSMKKTTMRPWR